MPQLDPTYFASQIFWLFLTFAFLYFMFARKVLPSVAEVLENRQNRLTGEIERAEALKKEAEDARKTYEVALAEARFKAGETLKGMHANIASMQDERKSKLDESLSRQMAEAEIRITKTREKALKEMEEVAVGVTQLIVEKLLDKQVDEKAVRQSLTTMVH